MGRGFLVAPLLVVIILASGCVSSENNEALDSFAQCLTNNSVKMYSSYLCSACSQQKQAFGSSFQYINHVECHPNGPNSQTQFCLDMGIEYTPTWLLEANDTEINRLVGIQDFESLAEFSGCVVV